MKVKKEKIKKSEKGFSARHVGVLLESMDKKIDTLVEGHIAHEHRFDRLEKKMDEEFSDVRSEMGYKFERVFEELHIIRSEQVKREEFALLEKRVMQLEKSAVQKKT